MYGIVTTTMKMDRRDRTVCIWLGQSFLNTTETTRSSAVVARSGRPQSTAREPLQDATMRSGKLGRRIRR